MFSRSPEAPTESVNKPPRPAPAPSGTPSIIATDVRIVGNVITSGEIQLDGTVEGDVRASSLTLGESGVVKGTVMADTVSIKGTIEGQIRGRSVRVEKTAKVRGDLCHEIVSVEAGAIVEGNFTHTANPLEVRKDERMADNRPSDNRPAEARVGDKRVTVIGDISDHSGSNARPAGQPPTSSGVSRS